MRDIFIIGAQKAGSTYLHNLLVRDPRIVGAPAKEPHFYSSKLHDGGHWEDLFPAGQDAVARIDSSVSYLHTEGAAERIRAARGSSALVLVTVRDPVDRAVSAYFHGVKHGRETRRIAAALDVAGADYHNARSQEERAILRALSRGESVKRGARGSQHPDDAYHDPLLTFRYVANSFYRSQLAPFVDLFEQVRVIDFPTLTRTPDRVLAEIYAILGLEQPVAGSDTNRTNPTRVAPRRMLRNYSRNLQLSAGSGAALVGIARAMPRIASLELDTKRAKASLPPLDWAAQAREEYHELLASTMGLT